MSSRYPPPPASLPCYLAPAPGRTSCYSLDLTQQTSRHAPVLLLALPDTLTMARFFSRSFSTPPALVVISALASHGVR